MPAESRRPHFINAETWSTWSEEQKMAMLTALPPLVQRLDPLLVDENCDRAPHDNSRDGPNQSQPFNVSSGSSAPVVAANPRATRTPVRQRNRGNNRAIQPRRESSRSLSPLPRVVRPANRRRSRSPHPSSSPPRSRSGESSSPSTAPSSLPETTPEYEHDLRSRVDRLERMAIGHPRGSNGFRGKAKKAKQAIQRRGLRRRDILEESEAEDDSDAEDLGSKIIVSDDAKKAKRFLQNACNAKFRTICGVSTSEQWPEDCDEERTNPKTGELYYTPNFESGVVNDTNTEIFAKVATLVKLDIETAADFLGDLDNTKFKWTLRTLNDFAKDSFRGFKVQFKALYDEERKVQSESNKQKNRRAQRRKEKAARLNKTGVLRYREVHDCDPEPLIIADHMSDEASGPEDVEVESKEEWKRRMATEHGISEDVNIDKIRFCEVIKPLWRSDKLSEVLHEIRKLGYESMSAKDREKISNITVNETGRTTNIPPLVAPYNFGINAAWHEREKNNFPGIINDWGKYAGPDGFDTEECNADIADAEDEDSEEEEDV